jgi:hypothetical protein
MELTLAELVLMNMVNMIKTIADVNVPGAPASLVARAGAVVKRLRWGQQTVARLALNKTTLQALKTGMAAEGDHQSAWAMDDTLKKSKHQLMELDHKAKAAAEKAMLIQQKRPRKQPRPRPRGHGREVRLSQRDWGKGQSKMAKKRRRQREQNGRQQPQPRPTGPPKKKTSHKDKICDICHEKGHIKYNCPKRTSQQPKDVKKE